MDGIAGNLLFADRFLVIVELGKKRLGLIRRNQGALPTRTRR
jgi:hypothetical protein